MTTEPEGHVNAVPTPARRKLWSTPVLAVIFIGVAALVAGPVWKWLGTKPPLTGALRLVALGQYEKAAPLLQKYLEYDPHNSEARVAMAEIILNLPGPRTDVRGREALAYLEGNRYSSPGQQAIALVFQGKAFDATQELGKAEAAYSLALRADPTVGEAGWLLLQTYYRESRIDETRNLALRLSRNEPDPRDRIRLLLEPCRPDAMPLSDTGVVADLERPRRAEPNSLPLNLAYYKALAGNGLEIDRATAGLRALVEQHPNELIAWDGLLGALVTTGQLDELAATLAKVPAALANNPRIVRHRGALALEQGDYAAAIQHLTAAIAARPYDVKSRHRLATAYKRAGKIAEFNDAQRGEDQYEKARLALRGIQSTKDSEGFVGAFQRAQEKPNLGLVPDVPLYRELASIRERMSHPDEAIAWHRLVLESLPADPESNQAIERLQKAVAPVCP